MSVVPVPAVSLAPDALSEEGVLAPLLLSGVVSVAEEVLVVEDAGSVAEEAPSDRPAPVSAPRLSVLVGDFEPESVVEPVLSVAAAAAVSAPAPAALPVPVTGAIMSCSPRGRTSRCTLPPL